MSRDQVASVATRGRYQGRDSPHVNKSRWIHKLLNAKKSKKQPSKAARDILADDRIYVAITTKLRENDEGGEQSTLQSTSRDSSKDGSVTSVDQQQQQLPLKEKKVESAAKGGSLVGRWKNITDEYQKRYAKRKFLTGDNTTDDERELDSSSSREVSQSRGKVSKGQQVSQRINLRRFDKVSRLIGTMALARSSRYGLPLNNNELSTTESHSSDCRSTDCHSTTSDSDSVRRQWATDNREKTTGTMNASSTSMSGGQHAERTSMSYGPPAERPEDLTHAAHRNESELRVHKGGQFQLDQISMGSQLQTLFVEGEKFGESPLSEIGKMSATNKDLHLSGLECQRAVEPVTSLFKPSFTADQSSDNGCSSSALHCSSRSYRIFDSKPKIELSAVLPPSECDCETRHDSTHVIQNSSVYNKDNRTFSGADASISEIDVRLMPSDCDLSSMSVCVNELVAKRDIKPNLVTWFFPDTSGSITVTGIENPSSPDTGKFNKFGNVTGSTYQSSRDTGIFNNCIPVTGVSYQSSRDTGIFDHSRPVTGIENRVTPSNSRRKDAHLLEAPPAVIMKKQQTLNLLLFRSNSRERREAGSRQTDRQVSVPTKSSEAFAKQLRQVTHTLHSDSTHNGSDDDVTVNVTTKSVNSVPLSRATSAQDIDNITMTSQRQITAAGACDSKSMTDGVFCDVIRMPHPPDLRWREISNNVIEEDEQEKEMLEITTVEEKIERISFEIREDLEFTIFKSRDTDGEPEITTDGNGHVITGVRPSTMRYHAVVDRRKQKSTKIEQTVAVTDEKSAESREHIDEDADSVLIPETEVSFTVDEQLSEPEVVDNFESFDDSSSISSAEIIVTNSLNDLNLIESHFEPSNFYFSKRTVGIHQ